MLDPSVDSRRAVSPRTGTWKKKEDTGKEVHSILSRRHVVTTVMTNTNVLRLIYIERNSLCTRLKALPWLCNSRIQFEILVLNHPIEHSRCCTIVLHPYFRNRKSWLRNQFQPYR